MKSPNVNIPLDGCQHVYLDVGSNIGVQVRKLYQPELFPNASVLEVFDGAFGRMANRNLSQLCAVGFEPNPKHSTLLSGDWYFVIATHA